MIIAYAGRCSAYGSLGQQTLGLNDCDQALALYARRCAAYGVFAKSWNSAAADLPGLRQQDTPAPDARDRGRETSMPGCLSWSASTEPRLPRRRLLRMRKQLPTCGT